MLRQNSYHWCRRKHIVLLLLTGYIIFLVNARAKYIGCSVAICKELHGHGFSSLFGVCNYGPGHIKGEKPYEKGKACSQCPVERPICEDSLCTGRPHNLPCKDRLGKDQCEGKCGNETCPSEEAKINCNHTCALCEWFKKEGGVTSYIDRQVEQKQTPKPKKACQGTNKSDAMLSLYAVLLLIFTCY